MERGCRVVRGRGRAGAGGTRPAEQEALQGFRVGTPVTDARLKVAVHQGFDLANQALTFFVPGLVEADPKDVIEVEEFTAQLDPHADSLYLCLISIPPNVTAGFWESSPVWVVSCLACRQQPILCV